MPKSIESGDWQLCGNEITFGDKDTMCSRFSSNKTHVPTAATGVFHLPIKLDALKGVLRYEFHMREYDVNFSGEYQYWKGICVLS